MDEDERYISFEDFFVCGNCIRDGEVDFDEDSESHQLAPGTKIAIKSTCIQCGKKYSKEIEITGDGVLFNEHLRREKEE